MGRRFEALSLLAATFCVLLVGLTLAAGVWIGLAFAFRHHWPWHLGPGEKPASEIDLTKVALSLVGGIGAAIALTVTYRRQRDLERGRFDERFAAAAAQLGADTAAQRLAGVYAIATLGDENESRRQQCADLLCAYIRLPYDPNAGLLRSVVSEHTWQIGTATGRQELTYERLPNDRDVRLAIIEVIRLRLQPDAATSWTRNSFDFSGATFDGGSFTGAVFARFIGFDAARFSGGYVGFNDVLFSGYVSFTRARFSSGGVDFYAAEFSGAQVKFDNAEFSGADVNFDRARFSSGSVDFDAARFSSGYVLFNNAEFRGAAVHFNHAEFTGGHVEFNDAWFGGGSVSFEKAEIGSEGIVTRNGQEFRGWRNGQFLTEPSGRPDA
jgi:hypothetical protein